MAKKKTPTKNGFTLIELIIAAAASLIVMAGLGVLLVDSQKGWHRLYNRAFSGVVTDAYIARKTFNASIRRASKNGFLVDDSGNWIEVYYYADEDSTAVDRYARFYELDGDLNLVHGKLDPKETLTVQTVCGNVSECLFTGAGRSAQMILTLDNGSQIITTVSCAFMHN
ncbi:MAG: PilW family protein [Planctomycetota bacterium]|jgi:prepilin-type N-terminal cleavage/methylation domain-containing protein